MSKKIQLGVLLILVILTTSYYLLVPQKIRIDVTKTRSQFSVYEQGEWVLGATEYINVFDGAAKMRAKSRDLDVSIGNKYTTITRNAYYKDNITVNDYYKFENDVTDIKMIPIDHTIECINCVGKIMHFEYRDIGYNGPTKTISSPFSFEHKMKLEFDSGYYLAKVYQQKSVDKIIIRYRPTSSFETYHVRLFDPPAINFSLDNLTDNVTAELGSDIDVIANISNSDVCVDIKHPEFGTNFSCSHNMTNFKINISWFRRIQFNDTNVSYNFSFNGPQNKTIYVAAHQWDDMDNATIDINGSTSNGTNPEDIKIYINNTLSNTYTGELSSVKQSLLTMNDSKTKTNVTLYTAGTKTVYLRLPKNTNVTEAKMNITGYTNFFQSGINNSDESYRMIIEADNLVVSELENSVCTVHNFSTGIWIYNCTNSTNKFTNRVEAIDTLFRLNKALNITNPSAIRTFNRTDAGYKYRHYKFGIDFGVGPIGTQTFTMTFTNNITNQVEVTVSESKCHRVAVNTSLPTANNSIVECQAQAEGEAVINNYVNGSVVVSGQCAEYPTGGCILRNPHWQVLNASSLRTTMTFGSGTGGLASHRMVFGIKAGDVIWDITGTDASPYVNSENFTGVPSLSNITAPTNVVIEVGDFDGVPEFNYTGEYNNSDRILNFSTQINTYLSTCIADINGFCDVPIHFSTVEPGTFLLQDIQINHTVPDVTFVLDMSLIKTFLINSDNHTDVPITIENQKNGSIIVGNLKWDYAGGNKSIKVTAHNNDSSEIVTYNITYFYSNWNYTLPRYVYYLEFIPPTSQSINVTPYGQTSIKPILNITTYNYGGKNMNFSVYMNESIGCVNITISTSVIKGEGTQLENNTWTDLFTDVPYLNESKLWMYMDYNCSETGWRRFYPILYFRGCGVDVDICDKGVS